MDGQGEPTDSYYWQQCVVLYFTIVQYHFHPTNVSNVWKVVSLASSSCGNETGQTLSGLNSDKVRIFLFHRKFQKRLKSRNFEHAKTLNSSLWKSKTEVTRKNFGMEKKKYDSASGTENGLENGI